LITQRIYLFHPLDVIFPSFLPSLRENVWWTLIYGVPERGRDALEKGRGRGCARLSAPRGSLPFPLRPTFSVITRSVRFRSVITRSVWFRNVIRKRVLCMEIAFPTQVPTKHARFQNMLLSTKLFTCTGLADEMHPPRGAAPGINKMHWHHVVHKTNFSGDCRLSFLVM
jgi:hypothetical protein